MRSTCSIEGCGGDVHARGWCVKHYTRWRRTGDPTAIAARVRKPKLACKQGHRFAGDNLRIRMVRGRPTQVCKTCSRDTVDRVRAKQRAARGGA